MKKSGFTLIEMLLYSLLAVLILGAVASFAYLILQSQAKAQVAMELEEQGKQILNIINQEIVNSDTVVSPTLGVTAASLSLTPADTVTLSGGVIYLNAVPLNNDKVTASALSFTNFGRASTKGSIRTSFVLTYINTDNRQEYAYQKTFISSTSLR